MVYIELNMVRAGMVRHPQQWPWCSYQEWMGHLEMLGLRMLSNSHMILEKGNARIVLAGVTDLSARRHSAPPPDLAAAIKGVPADTPILLLDHQPMMAEKAAASGVALQLSGHTHGGMVLGLDRCPG